MIERYNDRLLGMKYSVILKIPRTGEEFPMEAKLIENKNCDYCGNKLTKEEKSRKQSHPYYGICFKCEEKCEL